MKLKIFAVAATLRSRIVSRGCYPQREHNFCVKNCLGKSLNEASLGRQRREDIGEAERSLRCTM